MRDEQRRERAHRDRVPSERKAGEGEGVATMEPKGIYLRTVYPLNPGIPHFLDFPRQEG